MRPVISGVCEMGYFAARLVRSVFLLFVVFQSANAFALPGIILPADGDQLTSDEQLFTWSANTTNVDQWWLYVGTISGGNVYHNSGSITPGSTLEELVTGLPTDGSTVYARLWYREQGQDWRVSKR